MSSIYSKDEVTLNAICGLIINRDFVMNQLPKKLNSDQSDLLEILKRYCCDIQVAFDESQEYKLMKDADVINPDWNALIEVCHAFWRKPIRA